MSFHSALEDASLVAAAMFMMPEILQESSLCLLGWESDHRCPVSALPTLINWTDPATDMPGTVLCFQRERAFNCVELRAWADGGKWRGYEPKQTAAWRFTCPLIKPA